jgi:hypothetical protein
MVPKSQQKKKNVMFLIFAQLIRAPGPHPPQKIIVYLKENLKTRSSLIIKLRK